MLFLNKIGTVMFEQIVDILKNKSGVILIPTDTNYALAANAFDENACEKIYKIKRRELNKPLTLFISNPEEIFNYVHVNIQQYKLLKDLIDKYWPGPLNIIAPKASSFPKNKYIDQYSISVACNKNKILNYIIKELDSPLVMSSANISGVKFDNLISLEQATQDFGDMVDAIIKDDTFSSDRPSTTQSSTIISILDGNLKVVRQGDINFF